MVIESISPLIASTISYMNSTCQIWPTLKKRFSQPDDAQICHLQFILSNTNQGTKGIDAYFTKLNALWEELRIFRPSPSCDCGTYNERCFEKYINQYEKDMVFKFLNGLNESFAALRSQLLLMKPFPTLDEAYNLVLRKETQRSITHTQIFHESSAMATIIDGRKKEKFVSVVVCSYCGKP
ncbi:Uncharacterized protein TCM_004883 [Theobroma cacao]|uniref:Uncharacterized protein n=1 Tax=Theobroma cacao TaxID=3641 RepID=A0A061DRD7_THECC|nr:Uncharacterized protein TCM_004883 [Theobroma cacao]